MSTLRRVHVRPAEPITNPADWPARPTDREWSWLAAPVPGDALSADLLAGFAQVASDVATKLSEVLSARVAADVSAAAPSAASYMVRVRVVSLDATVMLNIDIDAARALLTPLLQDYSPVHLRALSDVQVGLLDYLTLAVVRRLNADGRDVLVESLGTSSVQSPAGEVCIGVAVRCGGHAGSVRVSFDPAKARIASTAVPDDTRIHPLWIALPGFDLKEAEVAALEAGDFIMLPLTDLAGTECTLLVDGGWEVGRGTIEAFAAGHVALAISQVAVRPADRTRTVVTIADDARSLAFLKSLSSSRRLDMSAERCLLWPPGSLPWPGELVRVRGELALRLVGPAREPVP